MIVAASGRIHIKAAEHFDGLRDRGTAVQHHADRRTGRQTDLSRTLTSGVSLCAQDGDGKSLFIDAVHREIGGQIQVRGGSVGQRELIPGQTRIVQIDHREGGIAVRGTRADKQIRTGIHIKIPSEDAVTVLRPSRKRGTAEPGQTDGNFDAAKQFFRQEFPQTPVGIRSGFHKCIQTVIPGLIQSVKQILPDLLQRRREFKVIH